MFMMPGSRQRLPWKTRRAATQETAEPVVFVGGGVLTPTPTRSFEVAVAFEGGGVLDANPFFDHNASADFVGGGVFTANAPQIGHEVSVDYEGGGELTATPTEIAPVNATTWSPDDKGSGVVLSGGNLIATTPSVFPAARAVRAIDGKSTGKWMYQFNWTQTSNNPNIGIGNELASLTANMGGNVNSAAWYMTGQYTFNNVNDFDAPSPGTDVNTVCVDVDAGLIWYRKGTGNWNNDAGADPATGTGGFDISAMPKPWYPMAAFNEDGNSVTANFGASSFSFTAPSGFSPWLVTDYVAVAVNFDGTNDYMVRGAGLTGAADSKLFLFSAWIRPTDDAQNNRIIGSFDTVGAGNANVQFRIQHRGATSDIQVAAENAAGTLILSMDSLVDTVKASLGYRHVLFSCDMSDTAKRHLYIQDSSSAENITYTNDTIDFTSADWVIGGTGADGTIKAKCDLADVMLWPGVYVDLSVEANRRYFIDANGKPVDPHKAIAKFGAPIVLQGGNTATVGNWHTNKAGGGGFTLNGTLTAASSSPSD